MSRRWSIFENESSCRSENESRFWKILQKIMIDKTARHFDVDLDELRKERVSDEQIAEARARLLESEKKGGVS